MVKFWSQVSKRAQRVTLLVLVCFCALMIFIVSEKHQMVYFLPDGTFQFRSRTTSDRTKTGHVFGENLEYLSTSATWPLNNVTSSMTTYKYSSAKLLPKIDITQIFEKYPMQRKAIARTISTESASGRNNSADTHYKVYYPKSQSARIHRIRQTCKKQELFRDYVYPGHYNTIYYYSSRYKFTYCKVPKSGSTVWTQIFDILKHGISDSKSVFAQKRFKVHGSMSSYTVRFNSDFHRHSSSILVSRDPFSRLYSAYIDKLYLLLFAKINFTIRKSLSKVGNSFCPVDVTFQEFLNYILLEAKKGKTLNSHWAPIYNLCRPCDVNAYILVKQESFSKDVEDALQAFGVEKNKLDVILPALKKQRVEATIPGILETVFQKIQHGQIRHCVDAKSISLRLWRSFIIQGFIKKNIRFPYDRFNSDAQYDDIAYVTEVILYSIHKHKMTSSEMKTQRQQALVDAYSEINDKTIEGIKELYKIDFEMFGYSTDLPSMNK